MQCHLPQYSTAEKMGVSAPSQHFARQKAQEASKAHDFQAVFQSKRARKVLQALNPKIKQNHPDEINSTSGQLLPQLCTSLGLRQSLLVSEELYKELNTTGSLQERDKSNLNAFHNKHPPATEANAIKRISFWHKRNQGNDMMYWQNFHYVRPKRQLKRVRPLLIR